MGGVPADDQAGWAVSTAVTRRNRGLSGAASGHSCLDDLLDTTQQVTRSLLGVGCAKLAGREASGEVGRGVASTPDHVAHLSRESARFLATLQSVAPETPVPSCPEWSADDLLWHLAAVQWFWATIVREHLAAPPGPENRPKRPDDRVALRSFCEQAGTELVGVLAEANPGDPAWTWSDDHTVGFIRRRQAHEALIHRVDAELTAGDRSSMDAGLAADGVDEALRVMYGTIPGWATFTARTPGVVRLQAADTGDSWSVTSGRLSGTDPTDGTVADEPCLRVAASDTGRAAPATITATAADLDCWLWRRPTLGPLGRSGDEDLLDRLEATIRPGID